MTDPTTTTTDSIDGQAGTANRSPSRTDQPPVSSPHP